MILLLKCEIQVWRFLHLVYTVHVFNKESDNEYCHLAWWSGATQRMLFSNIYWKALYPAEQEEEWNFKTSLKRRQWHLLVWINRGMIEKTRQDLETNIRSSDKSEYTIEAEEVTGKYIPRSERDVIRLRNPTED